MRISHLLESALTSLVKGDSDGLELAKILHSEVGVDNSDKGEEWSYGEMIQEIEKVNNISGGLRTSNPPDKIFVFKGSEGWGALYWLHRLSGYPKLLKVANGIFYKPDMSTKNVLNVIASECGILHRIFAFTNNNKRREFHKSLRNLPTKEKLDKRNRLQFTNSNQQLPGNRGVAERLWQLTPNLFTIARRDIRSKLSSGHYAIHSVYNSEEIIWFLDEVIAMNGKIDEESKSTAATWFYDKAQEEQDLDPQSSRGVSDDHLKNEWENVVVIALKKAGIDINEFDFGKTDKTKVAPAYLKKLMPFLIEETTNWLVHTFLYKRPISNNTKTDNK
jgi:hypothetical protein